MPTPDEKLGRSLRWVALGFLVVMVTCSAAFSRELPEIVEPSELSESWHDRKVAIFGYDRECELLQGRRGSNYIKCVVGTSLGDVDVYLNEMVHRVVGERVIVIGVYQAHGRFGGFPVDDHFIIAEYLIRDF